MWGGDGDCVYMRLEYEVYGGFDIYVYTVH